MQLTITTDKPVARGQLRLVDGTAVALSGHSQVLTANLVVSKDGSYRIALNDVDGLSNDGDTEYFIRMLNDRPPDVRILRPAGDKKVSPLEEVPIEARADDDYGVRSLELVIKSAGGKEKVVAIGGTRSADRLQAGAAHGLPRRSRASSPETSSPITRARPTSGEAGDRPNRAATSFSSR